MQLQNKNNTGENWSFERALYNVINGCYIVNTNTVRAWKNGKPNAYVIPCSVSLQTHMGLFHCFSMRVCAFTLATWMKFSNTHTQIDDVTRPHTISYSVTHKIIEKLFEGLQKLNGGGFIHEFHYLSMGMHQYQHAERGNDNKLRQQVGWLYKLCQPCSQQHFAHSSVCKEKGCESVALFGLTSS